MLIFILSILPYNICSLIGRELYDCIFLYTESNGCSRLQTWIKVSCSMLEFMYLAEDIPIQFDGIGYCLSSMVIMEYHLLLANI
ncbi:hypothetical protein mO206L [Vaccinia virus]|uniref:Uncharacterized protein n=2 Tax=Vaccinia virus TaxID=10245 RepID=Q49PE9_VACC0|nr:hypothetical protein m8206L [Vaccinia virus]AAW23877.1 hypothetical protein mO206L [Vaccinia virus]BBD06245.1 putative A ORF O [BAC cloning vector pLC16m8.8S-BAC]